MANLVLGGLELSDLYLDIVQCNMSGNFYSIKHLGNTFKPFLYMYGRFIYSFFMYYMLGTYATSDNAPYLGQLA